MATVRTAHKVKESYKMPWIILGQDFYQSELARLLMDSEFKLDPEDYDYNKGGLMYFHGLISRDEATARLKERGTNGVFLVRTGSTGGAVISIFASGTDKHVEIKQGQRGGVRLGSGPEMPSISQMMIANFGRDIPGAGVKFSIPVPPTSRIRTSTPHINAPTTPPAAPAAATVSAPATPQAGSQVPSTNPFGSGRQSAKSTTNPFGPPPTNPPGSTNPFGAPPSAAADVASLTVGELRLLLKQHDVDYRHANGRAELEMLAGGLGWVQNPVGGNAGNSRTASLTARARRPSNPGPIATDAFLELPAGNVRRSASTGQRPIGGGAKARSESALGKPQTTPTVQKATSALSLFAKYKNKSKTVRPAPAPTSPTTPTTPTPAAVSGQSPAAMPTQQSAPASISSATVSHRYRTASGSGSGEPPPPPPPPEKPTREEKKRLSVMANDFFGSLMAAPAARSDAAGTVIPLVVAQRSGSGSAAQPPPPSAVPTVVAEPEPASESEDDLSDDDSSDDDSDSDTEAEDNATGKGVTKASDKFWDKLKEADDSDGGDHASAEAKRLARREKLSKMANTNY